VAPSVQRRKVWLTLTTCLPCSNAAKTRKLFKFVGAKLPDSSQPLVGRSSPYHGEICRTYCCLTSFFPIVDTCLSCEDIVRQSCWMVFRWRFLATFLRPVFQRAPVQHQHHVSDLHLKFALRPHYSHYMAHIQSATADIRRGKKDRKNKRQDENIMVCPIP